MLGDSFNDPRTLAAFAAAQALLGRGSTMQRLAGAGSAYGGTLEQRKSVETERKRRDAETQFMLMRAQEFQRQAKAQQEAEQRRGSFLDAVDQSAGPAMPVSIPAALKAGLSLQEAGALLPSGGERKIVGNPKDGIWDITDPKNPVQIVKALQDADKPPSSVQEYQFAVSQGYGGSYEQWVKDKARAGASSTTVSYGAPVAAVDNAGRPVFIQPTKDGSPPMVVPGVRPPKSAAEERSEQEQATRRRQAEQMVSVLDDAEALLKQGTATASGVGTVADAAARAVGVTTKGAQDAARLQALSGWLVANVPRMEGPQSNFDVQNYMMMAGKVGDSTVPIQERMAALKTVRELQRKYAAINGTPMPEAAPESTKVRKYNPATGRLE